jgi:hypothetical protein
MCTYIYIYIYAKMGQQCHVESYTASNVLFCVPVYTVKEKQLHLKSHSIRAWCVHWPRANACACGHQLEAYSDIDLPQHMDALLVTFQAINVSNFIFCCPLRWDFLCRLSSGVLLGVSSVTISGHTRSTYICISILYIEIRMTWSGNDGRIDVAWCI